MAVTIGAAGQSLSAGRNRFIDRASDGTMWAVQEVTGTTNFWFSTNNGVNWTQATGSLTTTTQVSLFVDIDGGLNICYEGALTGFYFRRGTFAGSTITWGTGLNVTGNHTVHDLVAFRNPAGTGWQAVVATRSADGNGPHQLHRFIVPTSGAPTLAAAYTLTTRVQGGSGFGGTLDFFHTGDGKTIQGGTPHVYATFHDTFGTTWVSRLIWSGTTFTLVGATLTTSGLNTAAHLWSAFDGTRIMLAGRSTVNGAVHLYERDAANTATVDRGMSALLSGGGLVTDQTLSLSYDQSGNVHLAAVNSVDGDLYRTKWTRATATWDAAWTSVLAGAFNAGASLRVGWAGGVARIEGLVKDVTNLSYQEVLVLNLAPSAPTVLAPADGSVQDVAASLGISWQFNDPGDTQAAYTVRRRIGVLAFNYWNGTSFVAAESGATKIASSAASLGLAAGWGIDADADHFYSVKTWDTLDQISPWSAQPRVIPSGKDNPTITDPATNGFDITSGTYAVVWTVNTQTKYLIRVIGDTAGAPNPNVVDYTSGVINSTTLRTHTISLPVNSVTRQIELTTWNDEGLQSNLVYRIVDVTFTPPSTPSLSLNTAQVPGAIRATINNPAGGLAIASNDLFRRITGDTSDGIRIATGLPIDGVFTDYAVNSGANYTYRAKAIATTDAFAYSSWVT